MSSPSTSIHIISFLVQNFFVGFCVSKFVSFWGRYSSLRASTQRQSDKLAQPYKGSRTSWYNHPPKRQSDKLVHPFQESPTSWYTHWKSICQVGFCTFNYSVVELCCRLIDETHSFIFSFSIAIQYEGKYVEYFNLTRSSLKASLWILSSWSFVINYR